MMMLKGSVVLEVPSEFLNLFIPRESRSEQRPLSLAEVARAILDRPDRIAIMPLQPSIKELLQIIQILLLVARMALRLARRHLLRPSIIPPNHLHHIPPRIVQILINQLTRRLDIPVQRMTIDPIVLAVLRGELEHADGSGGVVDVLGAAGLLHGEGGEHDGWDAVFLSVGVEHGDVGLAGVEGGAFGEGFFEG